jgi:hypothetical protein
MVEHHPVTLGIDLLDMPPDIIQHALHVRAPCREIRQRLLERRHPQVAVVGDMFDAEGFKFGEAVGVLGVTVDVTGI